MSSYRLGPTEVSGTFAEAFPMRYARLIITAATEEWALEAARSATGFATSVIGCKCEAAIECPLTRTPDGRPGISVLLFAMDREGVGKRVLDRVGQCVMTCPTTACFDGLPDAERRVALGSSLRYFGDGFQASKVVSGERFWRIPVMEGEFLVVESRFVVQIRDRPIDSAVGRIFAGDRPERRRSTLWVLRAVPLQGKLEQRTVEFWIVARRQRL